MELLVLSGGRHPYEESTPILESFLKGTGHDVTVNEATYTSCSWGTMAGASRHRSSSSWRSTGLMGLLRRWRPSRANQSNAYRRAGGERGA